MNLRARRTCHGTPPAIGTLAAGTLVVRLFAGCALAIIPDATAFFAPWAEAVAGHRTWTGGTAHASSVESLSPALWDSVAALRRTLGAETGPESGGACLRDEHDLEFYLQNGRFWTEHHRAQTLAVEDTTAWNAAELGPDILLPEGAQILRTAVSVLGPDGVAQSAGNEARRRDPAVASPCGTEPARLRLFFPPLRPHSLLRWEIDWREPSATARATHWFGGDHPILESRFSFVFPKGYLDTDWGQFVRAVGPIPSPAVQDEVGPLQGDRRYTYRARDLPPRPASRFSAPRGERIPHLRLLPEPGGPESYVELLLLCNRIEGAAALDAATRESLLRPIVLRAADPAKRAALLHAAVMSRVRLVPLPLHTRGGLVRSADETWETGCGTGPDIAALLVAGLRELNLPARPLFARSRTTAAPDTTASDPSEFDRVLVEVGPAEGETADAATGGAWVLDTSCPFCPRGYLPADLQGVPALGIDHGVPRWRPLPSFPPATNWMRRTVVMAPAARGATMPPPGGATPDEDGPPPFTVTVERIAFGEPALRVREAGGLGAPGGEVLPARSMPGAPRQVDLSSPLPDTGDLEGPVTVRDTLRLLADRTDDGWRLPASFLGHQGLWPDPGDDAPDSRRLDPIVLPHTLVLVDSTVIVLPPGWTATSLPEPSMVQGAGFRFTTQARLEEGRVVVKRLLALEETRFTGARVRDLLDLAASVEAKDERGIVLRRVR